MGGHRKSDVSTRKLLQLAVLLSEPDAYVIKQFCEYVTIDKLIHIYVISMITHFLNI